MKLNTNKTNALPISRNNSDEPPNIRLGNESIQFVDSATSLGYIVQSNFQWDKYVLRQCGKIYACLRSVSLKSHHLNQDTKLKLFKSFILPHFISCDFLLNTVTVRTSDRLRIALNSCVRYVYGLNRTDRVTHLQATLLGYPFYNFIQARSCIIMHSIITQKCPAYLFSKLQPFRSSRLKAYVIPAHTTAFYGSTFFVRGVSQWNSLPNSLKTQQSLKMFKKQCKLYFN